MSTTTPVRLICVDGPAGAGKTTYAGTLAASLPNSHLIHMDDLYAGWDDDLGGDLAARLLAQIVEPLRNGAPVRYQRYDWQSRQFEEWVEVPAVDWLIIEGVGAAQEVLRAIAEDSVFIDVEAELGKARVIARDGAASLPHIDAWQSKEQAHFEREGTRERVRQVVLEG